MSAKVRLQICKGKNAGRIFSFTEHDTFIFGRMADCHACMPDDNQVSRHHFILEANPPQACLRDLGSLNGTWVNGTKCGAREKDESPEQGAKRRYPEVGLKDGDHIKVGQTELEVSIEQPKEAPQHRVDAGLGNISLLSPEQLGRLIFGISPGSQDSKSPAARSRRKSVAVDMALFTVLDGGRRETWLP